MSKPNPKSPLPIETDLPPVTSVEPLSRDILKMIRNSLGPIQCVVLRIGEVDAEAGSGIIDRNTKCLWTKDGRRITLNVDFGGFIGSVSNGIDPAKPRKS